MAGKKTTKEDFVIQAIDKFGKLYDYSGDYNGFQALMEFKCPIHETFIQSPRNHLRSKGCPKCNGTEKKTPEEFIKEVKEKYGNSITIDMFNGLQNDTIAICQTHGKFTIKAYNLLRNKGCPKCSIETSKILATKTHEQFVEESNEVHGSFYDYIEKYNGANNPIDIECPIHGVFNQSPSNHIRGRGCPQCGVLRQTSKLKNSLDYVKDIMNKIHNFSYDYSLINTYKNNKEKVPIICTKHGVFDQYVYTHMKGAGCPKCAHKISKPELEICQLFDTLGISYITSDRKILNGLELDIVIPDKKIAIEYNGLMFHREGLVTSCGIGGGKYQNYHLNKTIMANEAGYKLIHIFEDEWVFKKDIIISKILHLLGESKGIKVGARQCVIQKISSKESNEFLEKYHIQGGDNSAIRYGSYFKGVLVGVMTFMGNNEFKLNRFATNLDYRCIGLASKHLKHFIRECNPSKVTTFADRRFTLDSDNNVYINLGFKLVEALKPTYHYYNVQAQELKRYNRQNFMKHKILAKNPQFSSNMTEKQMMIELGFDRIWDCGNFKYEL